MNERNLLREIFGHMGIDVARRNYDRAGVPDRTRCTSVSPAGRLCSDDSGHDGLHSWGFERWEGE